MLSQRPVCEAGSFIDRTAEAKVVQLNVCWVSILKRKSSHRTDLSGNRHGVSRRTGACLSCHHPCLALGRLGLGLDVRPTPIDSSRGFVVQSRGVQGFGRKSEAETSCLAMVSCFVPVIADATLLFWRISVLRIVGNVYTAAAVAEAMVTLWTLHADAVEPKQIARFTLFAAAFAVGRFLCWSVHDRTRFGYLISRTCHSTLTLDVEGKLQ
jgi:hypothetical protein